MNRTRSCRWTLWSIFACGAMVTPTLAQTIVTAGDDAFRTPNGGASWDFGVSGEPIPADFFGPGSDPFEGIIVFDGDPINPPEFGPADTLVRRPSDTTDLDSDPSTTPIEIVALRFVSAGVITVTYNGETDCEANPQNCEEWSVRVCLSSTCPQCEGTMTITKTHAYGGTYYSEFSVLPKFTFTRVSDDQEEVLDFGGDGTACADICSGAAPGLLSLEPLDQVDHFWALLDEAGGPTAADLGIVEFGAGIGFDTDCDGTDDGTTIGNADTNFVGGVEWTGGRSEPFDCKKAEYAERALVGAAGGHDSYMSIAADADGDGIPDVCEKGACCDHAGPECLGWMTESKCMALPPPAQPQWFEGVTCGDPGFDCWEHTGACCPAGICTDDVPESACDSDNWWKDTPCDDPEVAVACKDKIPTISEWGLMVLTLLVLTAGTVVIGRSRRPSAA